MIYALRLAGGFLVIVALFAAVAALSNWPHYRSIPEDSGLLILAFTHGADRKMFCRKLSQEEIRKLPPNMRRTEECPRRRPPIDVELEVGNRTVFSASLAPTGIAGDFPSRVYERFVLPAGEYDIAVRMRDTPGKGFDHEKTGRIKLAAGQLFVIDFDPGKGFVFN